MFMTVFNMSAASANVDPDLGIIREQSLQYYSRSFDDKSAESYLRSLRPDGSWPDIDYRDDSRSHWTPRLHMARLEVMAACYAAPGSGFHKMADMLAAIRRGLEFWAAGNFESTNWWHQSIGIPQLLCETILLLGDDMPAELLERLTPILDKSKPGMTAQNRVWLAGIHLQKGILYNKPEWIAEGADIIREELYVAESGKEGLQPDRSFHQHGPQQQFGNYGLSYFLDMTGWSVILRGTRYEFPAGKIDILKSYYRDGLRWVLYDGIMDFSACGRQFGPGRQREKYMITTALADNLFRHFGDAGEDHTAERLSFSGMRYFYNSDFMVYRGRDFYYSVKMCSDRVVGSETINSENMFGRLTGHGATVFVSAGGHELEDIGALWNWRKIPGVTSVQNDSSLIAYEAGARNVRDWVGGLTDGEVGLCVMDFDNGELKAKKSYFFYNGMMTAVGSAVTSELDAPVHTTIAQHRTKLKIVRESDRKIIADAFRYELLKGDRIELQSGRVSGSWHDVIHAFPESAVDSGDMVMLWLDHGVKPVGASYVYTVSRSDAPEQPVLPAETSSADIHAVQCGDTLMAAFYRPGTVKAGRMTLTAEQPILAMIRGGMLYAADPSQKLSQAVLSCNGKTVKVALPGGDAAGSTVSIKI